MLLTKKQKSVIFSFYWESFLLFLSSGYYCNATFGPVVNYAIYPCPMGHYCPAGTKFDIQYPCAVGTFRNVTNGVSEEDCIPCSARYACEQTGTVSPTTLCAAGFYCRFGANTTTPRLGHQADECPAGHYCELGRFIMIKTFFQKQTVSNCLYLKKSRSLRLPP